ncbi:glycosyltransferase family 39 protein [Micromonospora sp. NBS 11-29]|uniref:glycosyltransferase family 39 protein n=1 Tax=Micromonospora sp. NBS 11-29 TaxID=1960879 RepID=UPI0015947180|nr:glycosyltransferase family 39 protein [Micromonospora sp. NBS 11-29]
MMDADTMVLPRLGAAEVGVEDPWGEDRPPRSRRVARASAVAARWRVAAWLLPALVMGGLGGAGLATPGLRAEELATWRAAVAPWPEASAGDRALVPYHLLVRAWAEPFGATDLALRVPSLLAMVAAAALVGALAARLFGPGTGVLAGVLLAVLPTSTGYAQEAQPHAAAVCAAVLATWLLLPVLDRPTARRLTAYAGAVVLLGLCQAGALLLLAGHGWVVLAFRRGTAGRWLCAAAPGVLGVAALLTAGAGGGRFLPPGVRPDPAVLAAAPRELFGVAALGVVLAALALFSLPLRYPAGICTAWALVPALGLLLVAWATPVWSPAALFVTVPAWAVLGAVALSRMSTTWAVAGLAVIALVGAPAQAAVRAPDGHGQDPRRVAAIVGGLRQPGDGVLYDDPAARTLVARYVPADRRPTDVLAVNPGLACAGCAGGPRRLWLIQPGHRGGPWASGDGDGPASRALRAGYRPARAWRPTGFTVVLLVGDGLSIA